MIREDNDMEGASTALDSLTSKRDVLYSCGYCGYALNLCSSHRNTTNIDSKYGKAIKKGVVSFYLIDESRFSHMDELRCLPFFTSKHSWGFFRQRTKLLCRKCGAYIGSAYDVGFSPVTPDNTSDSSSSNGTAKKYKIRIGALQPSSDESGIPLCT
ncbi:hypothetical protein J5N97_006032 [Dioscorea zingiberensis]|uniref:Uncharacterized protein n=1 Tax=Dioscorea zingiberensis TaxID=325984 RepID=A0A9D5HTC1_9LILI|nr:hypothetical protein J5N97_006032 [Dioscorea zingiberensis]